MTHPPDYKKISEAIAPVLEAAAERIHYAETRRVNYTVMAAALIAGGISILVFALGSIGEMWFKYAAITASISFVVVGLYIIFIYGRQTNQYPYTSATKTWKWFYRDALPDRNKFALKFWERSSTQKKRITSAYTDQLSDFESNLLKLQTEETNAKQDIEQLYSFHVNELYKNLYLSRLRTIFNRGLVLSAALSVFAGFYGLYREVHLQSMHYRNVENALWSEHIEWRLLSEPLADDADITIHITVVNKGSEPIEFKKIVVRDENGWPLPVEIKAQEPFPEEVASRHSADLYASAHTSRAIWQKVTHIVVEFR